MEILISKQKVLAAVRIMERVVSRNVSLPILNNILFKGGANGLTVSATNLELGLIFTIGAKISETGEFLVSAKLLNELLSNIEDEKIEIISSKNNILVKSENIKTTLLVNNTHEFPIIPQRPKDSAGLKINSRILRDSLANVVDAASLSETRPELSGVFIKADSTKIDFAATDSFRLAEKSLNITAGEDKTIIVPRNTVLETIRVLENKDEDVFIEVSDNQMFLVGPGYELISRLIDGKYPDYKKIIPEKEISTAIIPKKELERNIRLAGVFSSSISDIKIEADEDSLEITAQNSSKGDIKAKVKTKLQGQPFFISINYNYFLDGLKNINTENVKVGFSGQGNPVTLSADGKSGYIYIIMPLRA